MLAESMNRVMGGTPPVESIRIAIRVRPFNSREKERHAKCCVKMDGSQTAAIDPDTGKISTFGFDYSYWSHDGALERNGELVPQSTDSHYADQRRVFQDLGVSMLDAAAEGYNSTLMAYGQTGSGKSYTMFGYGSNKGLIPMLCEELFRRFGKGDERSEFHISMSFCEIYNERVKDLLSDDPSPLRVRQSPTIGFYVEGLKELPVANSSQIEYLVDKGTKNRSVAATKMNETSSRAHAIITLKVQQVEQESKAEKLSTLHLVDLAGSERVSDTGLDQKDRLREAGNINSSLSVLGTVIAALVQVQQGKKNAIVPYRDSVLTKLLQNSLGGNSKTIMIGAISPAETNYDETLSTLRFLDRAKAIKTVAIVNENPTDKLIRELRTENERLKALLAERERLMGPGGTQMIDVERSRSPEEQKVLAALQLQIAEKERDIKKLEEANKSWEQRLEEAKAEFESRKTDDDFLEERKLAVPNLKNVNEDPLLSGMLFYFIETGKHLVGRVGKGTRADIQLNGLSILPEHALITNTGNTKLTIRPCNSNARIRVNGILLTDCQNPVTLQHNDRVLIGTQHLYLVKFPHIPDDPDKEPTWEDAQAEIAQGQGFGKAGDSEALSAISSYIVEFLPLVNEANAIAEDLGKPKRFELGILGDEGTPSESEGDAVGISSGGSRTGTLDVVVPITDLDNGFKWLWSKERFRSTAYRIQDLYQRLLEDGTGSASQLSHEDDPFDFSPEDYIIGLAAIPFQQLLKSRELNTSIIVRDYKGSNEGILKVGLSITGKALPSANATVGSRDSVGSLSNLGAELLGRQITFRINIENILGLRWTRGGVKCRFKFGVNNPDTVKAANTENTQKSPTALAHTAALFRNLLTSSTLETDSYFTTRTLPSSTSPQFDDKFETTVKKLTQEQLNYLQNELLFIEVWGDHTIAAREPTGRSRVGTVASMSPTGNGRDGTPTVRTRVHTAETMQDTDTDLGMDTPRLKAELVARSRMVADLAAKNFNLNNTIISLNSEIAHLRQELISSKRDISRLRQASLPPHSFFSCFTVDGRTISSLRHEIGELERTKSTVEEELARLRADTSFLIAKEEVLARLDSLGKLVKELQAPGSSPRQGHRTGSPDRPNQPKLAPTTEEDESQRDIEATRNREGGGVRVKHSWLLATSGVAQKTRKDLLDGGAKSDHRRSTSPHTTTTHGKKNGNSQPTTHPGNSGIGSLNNPAETDRFVQDFNLAYQSPEDIDENHVSTTPYTRLLSPDLLALHQAALSRLTSFHELLLHSSQSHQKDSMDLNHLRLLYNVRTELVRHLRIADARFRKAIIGILLRSLATNPLESAVKRAENQDDDTLLSTGEGEIPSLLFQLSELMQHFRGPLRESTADRPASARLATHATVSAFHQQNEALAERRADHLNLDVQAMGNLDDIAESISEFESINEFLQERAPIFDLGFNRKGRFKARDLQWWDANTTTFPLPQATWLTSSLGIDISSDYNNRIPPVARNVGDLDRKQLPDTVTVVETPCFDQNLGPLSSPARITLSILNDITQETFTACKRKAIVPDEFESLINKHLELRGVDEGALYFVLEECALEKKWEDGTQLLSHLITCALNSNRCTDILMHLILPQPAVNSRSNAIMKLSTWWAFFAVLGLGHVAAQGSTKEIRRKALWDGLVRCVSDFNDSSNCDIKGESNDWEALKTNNDRQRIRAAALLALTDVHNQLVLDDRRRALLAERLLKRRGQQPGVTIAPQRSSPLTKPSVEHSSVMSTAAEAPVQVGHTLSSLSANCAAQIFAFLVLQQKKERDPWIKHSVLDNLTGKLLPGGAALVGGNLIRMNDFRIAALTQATKQDLKGISANDSTPIPALHLPSILHHINVEKASVFRLDLALRRVRERYVQMRTAPSSAISRRRESNLKHGDWSSEVMGTVELEYHVKGPLWSSQRDVLSQLPNDIQIFSKRKSVLAAPRKRLEGNRRDISHKPQPKYTKSPPKKAHAGTSLFPLLPFPLNGRTPLSKGTQSR
ncbi:kinesin-domain-containing protein [Gonapodya prolifera JEL478]|uniref:Kinesin-like protein 6 n=1 Tax=Gonapodya prolifera (strain JEL478) TaxID=1344416 RepID=A0A139B1A0_GONPJ|nr:kinesin-domain-containing protein [Gonapodya prolifera JEL478]|eukprot:KXS22505.1 kinesin-domain-containing protein [Gonapodya prolifera JEL478]